MATAAIDHLETPASVRLPTMPVLHRSALTVSGERRQTSRAADFYSTALPWILLAITLLPFVLLLVWLVLAYFGIEYATPSWNAHSVPPPQLY